MRALRVTGFKTAAAAVATVRVPLPPVLSPLELEAWEGMLLIRRLVLERLDDELRLEQRLPLTHHDVLLKLSQAPGGQQRMSELADRVLLTKSGLTRVIDVLEKNGFVERVRSAGDARARCARLTPAGRTRLQAAHPVHVRGVRTLFLDKLSDDQLHCLVETWRSLGPPQQTATPAPGRPSPGDERVRPSSSGRR